MSKNSKFSKSLVAIACGVATAVVAASALAFTPTSPTVVEYSQGTLLVQALQAGTPTNYVGLTASATGCGTETSTGSGTIAGVSVDTLKIWQSEAQSALLSGKKLMIYSQKCTSVPGMNVITTIDLQQ